MQHDIRFKLACKIQAGVQDYPSAKSESLCIRRLSEICVTTFKEALTLNLSKALTIFLKRVE